MTIRAESRPPTSAESNGLSADVNPVTSIHVPKAKSRERVYTDIEMSLIWAALENPDLITGLPLSRSMALAIQLAILTLQRAGEVIGAQMYELDLHAKTWTIPENRTKNHRTHVVPLSVASIGVIEGAIELNQRGDGKERQVRWDRANGPLFPSQELKKPMARHSMTRAMNRLLKVQNISGGTLHDLRRTGATNLTGEQIGLPRFIVSQILNHQGDTGGSSAVTRVHGRNTYLPEKRQGLQAWAEFVSRIVNSTNQ